MTRWEGSLAALDAGGPWFEPWRRVGNRVGLALAAGIPMHEALNLQAGAAVRFAPPEELPPGVAYEQYIFETRRCPTRDNLHDFFNALCWLEFPLAKARLNALQAGQIAASGVRSVRGPLRDAITVFDENGAVLHAPPALWDALAARDWQGLFVDLRPLWAQARLVVFGHAMLEKLVSPRKELAAHVWRSQCPLGSAAEVDGWLDSELTAKRLAGKPFAPLPLLGIPGWSQENQNFSFYDDSLVFRPPVGKNEKTTAPAATSGS